MKTLTKSITAIAITVGMAAQASAAVIGAGTGILDLAGANNAVDTPSDGSNDQSRQNLDITFTSTLAAGTYKATSWSFRAGQTGSVIPYLAVSPGGGGAPYKIIGVGNQVDVTSVSDADVTQAFGGSDTFVLDSETTVYAGIVNPPEAGAQNPVFTNLASGSFVDHDNNADGNISLAVVDGEVDGLGHANLGRSYAFSVDVEPIPEPSSALLALAGVGGLLVLRRRSS